MRTVTFSLDGCDVQFRPMTFAQLEEYLPKTDKMRKKSLAGEKVDWEGFQLDVICSAVNRIKTDTPITPAKLKAEYDLVYLNQLYERILHESGVKLSDVIPGEEEPAAPAGE